MTIQAADEADAAAAASWLLGPDIEWWQLVRFGVPEFAVHARIAFPVDPDADTDHARVALATLTSFTHTPNAGFAAIWEGWGGGGSIPRAPRVEIPHRSMVLLTGPVAMLRDAAAIGWGDPYAMVGPPPHLAWPADRSWCFACEVDEDVEFTVGCTEDAFTALEVALPGSVRRAAYGEDAPLYRDEP